MKITVTHCQSCGATDSESVDYRANDGYSACCNERIISPGECDLNPEARQCYHTDNV